MITKAIKDGLGSVTHASTMNQMDTATNIQRVQG